MGCSHSYVFTRRYFVCTKCGKRSYGRSYKKKQGKKIATGIIISLVVIIGIFAYSNDIIDINQKNLEQSLGKITSSIPGSIPETITDSIPSSIELSIQELVGKTVHTIEKTTDDITKYADEIGQPSQTTSKESQDALDYINQLRTQNGRQTITWDSRVFSLASAWSQELYETGQFDHTNPVTGNCPATLKSKYGLSSNEDVADNLYSIGSGYNGQNPTLSNPNSKEAIDGWMDSVGHRYNLLFHDHVAGAYACYGGLCSFMGLNHEDFGSQCSTAAEGKAHFAKLDSCTPQQLSQYDNILKNYSDDVKEYNSKVPAVTSSQSEYQFYMNWLQDLEQQELQIDNFRC